MSEAGSFTWFTAAFPTQRPVRGCGPFGAPPPPCPPLPAPAVRMLAALEQVQIEHECLYDVDELVARVPELPNAAKQFVISEMRSYAARLSAKRIGTEGDDGLERLVRMVAGHVLSRPIYYLWQRKG